MTYKNVYDKEKEKVFFLRKEKSSLKTVIRNMLFVFNLRLQMVSKHFYAIFNLMTQLSHQTFLENGIQFSLNPEYMWVYKS